MHAIEAELAELGEQLARQDPLLEPFTHIRSDLFSDELADGVADRFLLVVEERVEREEVEGVGRLGLGWCSHGFLRDTDGAKLAKVGGSGCRVPAAGSAGDLHVQAEAGTEGVACECCVHWPGRDGLTVAEGERMRRRPPQLLEAMGG